MLHAFNYTSITYGYFNIRSWDKDQSTQHEMAILKIKCLTTEKEPLIVLKRLKIAVFEHS